MTPPDDYSGGSEEAGREPRRPRGSPEDRRPRAGGERSGRSHGRSGGGGGVGGGGGTEERRKSRHGPRGGPRGGTPAGAVTDDTEGPPGSGGRRLRASHGRHGEHRGGLLPLPAATTAGSLWLTGSAKRGGRLPWSNILRAASALALLYLLLFQMRTLKEQPTLLGANRGAAGGRRPSPGGAAAGGDDEAPSRVHADRPAARAAADAARSDGGDGGGGKAEPPSRDFHPSMPASYSDLFNPGGGKKAPAGSGPTVAEDATPPFLTAAKAEGAAAGGAPAAAGGDAPAVKAAEPAAAADAAGGAAGGQAAKGGDEADKGANGSDGGIAAAAAAATPSASPDAAGGAASSPAPSGATGGGGPPAPAKEPTKEDFLATVARKKKKAAAAAAEAAAAAKAAGPAPSSGSPGKGGGSREGGGGDRDGSSGRGSEGADGGGGGGGAPGRQHPPSGSHNGSTPGQDENFWKWFQQTKGAEHKDASKAVECPEENHRLCETFYKYLRKYKIRTVLDASCGTNVEWMPMVLKQVGSELWGFRYYCMNTGPEAEEGTERAKAALSEFPFVEFVPSEWWVGGFPDGLDLVFSWDVLPHTAYGRVWSFFMLARKHAVRYLLFDNYPGLLNNPSPKRKFINVRKHPFKFPAAKEVVQNVTEPGEHIKRQLLFYETESLPEHLTT